MSALEFEVVATRQQAYCCDEPGCTRSGRFRMMLAGWVAGIVCLKCRRQMQAAWDGALDDPIDTVECENAPLGKWGEAA